jgi:hypothetical protein
MRQEFELGRRSKLKTQALELGDVVSTLAVDPQARAQFLRDPAGFLSQHEIPVGACKLTADRVNRTTETVCPILYMDCASSVDTTIYYAALVIGREPEAGLRRSFAVVDVL